MTQVPVFEAIIHPPLGLLQRDLIAGVFTGSGDLTRPSGPLNVDGYGLTWTFFSVPAPFGYELGSPIVYHDRMIQLSAIHRDLAGHDLVSEYHAFNVEGIYWLWENPFPQRIHYEIQVGVSVIFSWLVF